MWDIESIINTFRQPTYLSQKHKENSEYYDEFEKAFEKGLSYEQEKDLNSLIPIKNAVESTEFDYALLFGMQIKSAIDEIIKNPAVQRGIEKKKRGKLITKRW